MNPQKTPSTAAKTTKKIPSPSPKRGAPTKRTPETEEKVIKALKLGTTFEEAATYAGITYETLNQWRKQFPEFSDACKKARIELDVDTLDAISTAGAKSWQALAWILERIFPEKYSRRMLIGGVDGADPIKIEESLKIAGSIRSNKEAMRKLNEAIAAASGTE